MATVPTPKTWAAWDTPTADDLNTHLRDPDNFLLNPPRVWLSRNAQQSIPTTTSTLISWDGENTDPDGMWSSGDPTKIYCNTPGLWLVTAHIVFTSDNSDTGYRRILGEKNAAGAIVSDTRAPGAGIPSLPVAVEFFVELAVNDYLRFYAYQNSGVSKYIGGGLTTEHYVFARWVSKV